MCTCVPWQSHGNRQRTISRTQFSPSTLWVLGIRRQFSRGSFDNYLTSSLWDSVAVYSCLYIVLNYYYGIQWEPPVLWYVRGGQRTTLWGHFPSHAYVVRDQIQVVGLGSKRLISPHSFHFKLIYLILCTLVSCLHICLSEDVGASGSGVTGSCELQCGCWELTQVLYNG